MSAPNDLVDDPSADDCPAVDEKDEAPEFDPRTVFVISISGEELSHFVRTARAAHRRERDSYARYLRVNHEEIQRLLAYVAEGHSADSLPAFQRKRLEKARRGPPPREFRTHFHIYKAVPL